MLSFAPCWRVLAYDLHCLRFAAAPLSISRQSQGNCRHMDILLLSSRYTSLEAVPRQTDDFCRAFMNPGAGKRRTGISSSPWAAQEGQDFLANHVVPSVDLITTHIWSDNWMG